MRVGTRPAVFYASKSVHIYNQSAQATPAWVDEKEYSVEKTIKELMEGNQQSLMIRGNGGEHLRGTNISQYHSRTVENGLNDSQDITGHN